MFRPAPAHRLRTRRPRTARPPLLPRLLPWLLAGLLLSAAAACERNAGAPPPEASQTAQSATGASEAPVILMLGDSLTAGYGLPTELSYPALLQQRLEAAGLPHRIVNAGVSGDTSAGGLSRLDWLLRQHVDLMVVALGANDGLRGQSTDALRANLARIIERAQARGIRVVLAGMRMPANYGLDYTRSFAAVYPALAEQYGVALIPFLLDGVALDPDLNQADGIHPNAEGARIVADHVWQVLEPLLRH